MVLQKRRIERIAVLPQCQAHYARSLRPCDIGRLRCSKHEWPYLERKCLQCELGLATLKNLERENEWVETSLNEIISSGYAGNVTEKMGL